MNDTLQNTLLTKIRRFSFPSISSFNKKKRKASSVVPSIDSPIKAKVVLPNPALVLPTGILPITSFRKLVMIEKTESRTIHLESFVLQLNLIHKNCKFLTEEGRKILALDCLKYLQKKDLGPGNVQLGFGKTGKLWLLFPNLDEQLAIHKAKTAFNILRKFLRKELDIQLPLIELNMYKIDGYLPAID